MRIWMLLPVVVACGTAEVVVPQPTTSGAMAAKPAANPMAPTTEVTAGAEAGRAAPTADEPDLSVVEADVAIDVGVNVAKAPNLKSTLVVRYRHKDGRVERSSFGPYPGLCGYDTAPADAVVTLECWAPKATHDLRLVREGESLVVYHRRGGSDFSAEGTRFSLPPGQDIGFL